MASETLHIAMFIEWKYGWNFHAWGGRFVDGVPMVVVDLAPGVSDTAVMAGKTDPRFGNNLRLLIRNQIRSLTIDEKGVNPAIVTDCTFLGRVWISWCLIGKAWCITKEYGTKKQNQGAGRKPVHGKVLRLKTLIRPGSISTT